MRVHFFLPATVFGLPLRVRALVLVRWPRVGRPYAQDGGNWAVAVCVRSPRVRAGARWTHKHAPPQLVLLRAKCGSRPLTHHDVPAAAVAANVFQALDVLRHRAPLHDATAMQRQQGRGTQQR
jgi:hypothetical protein